MSRARPAPRANPDEPAPGAHRRDLLMVAGFYVGAVLLWLIGWLGLTIRAGLTP